MGADSTITLRGRTLSTKVKLALVAISIVSVFGLLAFCGCSPAPAASHSTETEGTPTASTGAESPEGLGSFQEISTGLFPDTSSNQLRNTGNRGCNSCHDDLYTVMNMTNPKHIISNIGYGKKVVWGDCQPCHDMRVGRAGIYLADSIHASHYANPTFTDAQKGNCWSCHQSTTDANGNTTLALYDEVKYEAYAGGYPTPTDTNTRWWIDSRGISDGGYMTSVGIDENPVIDVKFSQPASNEEDNFVIDNWDSIEMEPRDYYYHYEKTTSEPYTWSLDDSYDNWSLEVKGGVNNPRSFTMEELKALPQTEYTATQNCETSGLGCTTISNIPVKGVLLKDIIEACGGLTYDASTYQFLPLSADSWTGEFFDGVSLQSLLDVNAMVALQYYGHDLTVDNGNQATIVAPGMPGAEWCKHLVSINFAHEEDSAKVFNPYENNKDIASLYALNSAFFQEDGVRGKVGEPVALTGYSFSWAGTSMGRVTSVDFSLDYGDTWQSFDVDPTLDPLQWAYWDFTWTPEEAGTYIVKVQAHAEDGTVQTRPVNLLVIVEE